MLHLLKKGGLFASAGGGVSGGKFLNMKNGAEQSVAAGFLFKPTLEVQTGFFHRHFLDSGMRSAFENREPFDKIKELSQKAKWNGSEQRMFEQAHRDFAALGEPALMIRSNTTLNDKTGNGAYSSKSIISTPENIANAAKEIALSFFTDKARMVREAAGIANDEFAIMLQPVIWDRSGQYGHFEMVNGSYEMIYDTQIYAPRLSGTARTITPYGDPRIGLVRGLAFNYMTSPECGVSIGYPDRNKTLGDLHDAHYFGGMDDFKTATMKMESGLYGLSKFGGYKGIDYGESVFGKNFLVMGRQGEIVDVQAAFSQGWREIDEWTASCLFEIMLALKGMRKSEQSIEFAMVRDEKGNPLYYQTQRTDCDVPFFRVDEGVDARLVIGKNGIVMGAGERKIRDVARISRLQDWHDLRHATEKYPGIAVSLSNDAFQKEDGKRSGFVLNVEALRNASAIMMDFADPRTMEFFEAHVGGMLSLMNLTLVAFEDMDFGRLAKNSRLVEDMEYGIKIYKTDATLQASEKGQKAVLYLNKEAKA
ncbi:MAG: hypothetical protein WC263_00475 [Candidatus Micrarchaeia archaeon]